MDERHLSMTTPPMKPEALSLDQREVVELIAEGLTNAEISYRLGVTPGTAANRVESVLRRLGTATRLETAMWAISHGLVGVAPPPASDGSADGIAAF